MKTIIDSAGGGEVKSREAEAGGPRPLRRGGDAHPTPPGGSPGPRRQTRSSAAGTHPFMSSWVLAWRRKQDESLRRLAAAKAEEGGREGGETERDSRSRRGGGGGKERRLLTEPLPPPAAAALSTRRSPAAFCVLLPAPRLPSA